MAVNINVPSQVKTYANLAAFPATGALKTIYIAEDTNKTYRWTGSVYTEISASAAMTWGAIGGTLSNQTDLQSALDAKQNTLVSGTNIKTLEGQSLLGSGNIDLTKSDVGLSNVDNTSDLNKPISTATQNALNAKENTITAGTTSQYFRGDKTFQTLDKAAVGLGNVDNTSDANKPISTATQTALNAKQDTLSLTTTGSSGASTLVGATLNVPNYTLSGLGGVPTSRTLTINGVTQDLSADRTFTISTGITIGSTAIASGTVGRILFEGAGNVVQESANLFWDNTNARLGIGTSTPTQPIEVVKNQNAVTTLNVSNTTSGATAQSLLNATANSGSFGLGKVSNTYTPYKNIGINDGFLYNSVGGDIAILNDVTTGRIKFTAGSVSTTQMILFTTGNVGINTTTDAGFRLDVNGTARVQGELTVNGVQIGLGGGAVTSNTRVGTNALNANTTGSNNTAVGVQANRFNTTGSFNGAFGLNALGSNTASLNDAFGFFSAYSNTTGSNNSAFGAQSLEKNTTGSNNIAMGLNSGRYITDGVTANAITNNSIFLGVDSKALANNQTNQIVIGHNAIGAGSNTVTLGNTSIVKTILRGTLNAANLPTSPAGLSSGDIYNNLGVLMIV